MIFRWTGVQDGYDETKPGDYTADPAVLFSDVGDGLATAGVMLNPTRVSDVLAVADAVREAAAGRGVPGRLRYGGGGGRPRGGG